MYGFFARYYIATSELNLIRRNNTCQLDTFCSCTYTSLIVEFFSTITYTVAYTAHY